ncbi:hypothetical protein [Streptomyces atroolivaceus]|uniref:hypothetical protein n=1 Tax=Streptomyces atroolivaceus TaxID=66869 RepID=UPI0036435A3A
MAEATTRLFDGDERNRALGIWSALGGGGAALGVLLGGLITAGPGWAWRAVGRRPTSPSCNSCGSRTARTALPWLT